MISDLPDQICPNCGYKMDAVASIGAQRIPTKDDVSICNNCGAINLFNDKLQLVKPDDGQLLNIMLDPVWDIVEITQKKIIRRGRINPPSGSHVGPSAAPSSFP